MFMNSFTLHLDEELSFSQLQGRSLRLLVKLNLKIVYLSLAENPLN